MTRSLAGRVAIVTGAARGMGAAHARRLIEDGAQVLLTDILEEEGRALAAGLGDRAAFARHDVTALAEWADIVRQCVKLFGRPTILVNNAGIFQHKSIEETTEDDYMKVIRINQLGPFLGMQAVIPEMKAAGGGSIVNISSTCGLVGLAGTIAYTASKFAVRGMTKTAAAECAPFNIRVNSVHPGIVETPILAGATDEMKAQVAGATPLNRVGEPSEVANLVAFLASDESSFCTGGEFVADGGATAI